MTAKEQIIKILEKANHTELDSYIKYDSWLGYDKKYQFILDLMNTAYKLGQEHERDRIGLVVYKASSRDIQDMVKDVFGE